MVCIFDPSCELLPPWTKDYTCVLLPLYCTSTFSLTSFPLPNVQYIQTVCDWGGGGVLKCIVDHILQEFYTLFLTRFRTYKIASPPQTKMTSKDDIKGLVSLKFLRPWVGGSTSIQKIAGGGSSILGCLLYTKNSGRRVQHPVLALNREYREEGLAIII